MFSIAIRFYHVDFFLSAEKEALSLIQREIGDRPRLILDCSEIREIIVVCPLFPLLFPLALTACWLAPIVLNIWSCLRLPDVYYLVADLPCQSGTFTRWNYRPCSAAHPFIALLRNHLYPGVAR